MEGRDVISFICGHIHADPTESRVICDLQYQWWTVTNAGWQSVMTTEWQEGSVGNWC